MAIYPQNLHTHGTLCDGKYEYEETVKRAIELGFTGIGFSGHSYTPYDPEACMTLEGTAIYKKRIAELKEKYAGIIDVFCGIEFDLYSEDDPTDYEYVIGDVHNLKIGNEYLVIDYSDPAVLESHINNYFDGDGLKCAKSYYEAMAQLPNLPKCDIAGHFDLITKHIERRAFFNTESKEYQTYALDAVTSVAEKIKIFEINVGAIARGYRSIPYPEPFILKRIKELNCNIIISTDCHDIRYLDTNMDVGVELAKACGFNEALILTNDGFKEIKI